MGGFATQTNNLTVVSAIYLFTHHREIHFRYLERVCLEFESDRWHSYCCLQLCRRLESGEAVPARGVLVRLRFVPLPQYQLVVKKRGRRDRVYGWPLRLVHNGTFFMTSVAVLPSALNVSLPSGTGTTQYIPSGEIGG